MKKKIIAILIIMLAVAIFTACTKKVKDVNALENEEPEYSETIHTRSMFVEIEETYEWTVVYHRETKVMYVVSRGQYNNGTFTPLLNVDGSPMIWEDEER